MIIFAWSGVVAGLLLVGWNSWQLWTMPAGHVDEAGFHFIHRDSGSRLEAALRRAFPCFGVGPCSSGAPVPVALCRAQ